MSTTTLTNAQRIVERLKREDRARHDRIVSEAKQLRELRADKAFKVAELERHKEENLPKRRFGNPAEPAEPTAADRRRLALEAEIDAQDRGIAALEAKRTNRPASLSGERVEDSLQRLGRYREDPAEPVLKKGETPRAALDRYDYDIDNVKAERKAIAQRPRTAAEIQAQIDREVDFHASRGGPRVAPMLNGGDLTFPQAQLDARHGHHFQHVPDGVAMLCWLFPDLIKERLADMVDVLATDDRAMSASEQSAAIKKIDARLFQLHRERAAIVEQIVSDGGEAFHRADAPIEAVLQISR